LITYLFGKPGSGKSYKAITLILEALKTKPVFSNIELTRYVAGYKQLDKDLMKDWLSYIEDIYITAQEELTSEEDIYKKLRDKDICDCAIFIDEAHIYGFNDVKKKGFLMFFLSLQRHVNLDIYLITQTKKQLASVFHDLGDVVILAISATERLLPNVFEYRYFSHVDNIKNPDDAFRNEKLISKQEIFEYYTSGENNTGDDGFRKKLKFLIAGILVVALFVVYQFSNLMSAKKSEKSFSSANASFDNYDNMPNASSSFKYIELTCIVDICKNKENNFSLHIDDLKTLLKDTDSKYLRSVKNSVSMASLYLLVSPSFLGLFKNIQGAKKNEKNEGNDILN
jgi:hypothetical protein